MLCLGSQFSAVAAPAEIPEPAISETAALRCSQKLKEIEDFATLEKKGKPQATRLTEEEINSYIMTDITGKYKACLTDLKMAFKQNNMEGAASVDFDCLKEASSESVPQLITRLFSGIHAIKVQGTVISGDGKGNFNLEQVWFDGSQLPKFLVEEAITSVCKRRDPPIDPMQPSPLPYNIKKITIHPGYIMVYQ